MICLINDAAVAVKTVCSKRDRNEFVQECINDLNIVRSIIDKSNIQAHELMDKCYKTILDEMIPAGKKSSKRARQ